MESNNTYTTANPVTLTSGITTSGITTSVVPSLLGGTIIDTYSSGITTTQTLNSFISTPIKQIMQNKVAVFRVVRDEDDKIIKTEFIKELWVETKNGVSVEFQVARDTDLAEYDASELVIKTISSVSF
jgi:DNA-binding transcriptional regulator of glucitol operon